MCIKLFKEIIYTDYILQKTIKNHLNCDLGMEYIDLLRNYRNFDMVATIS